MKTYHNNHIRRPGTHARWPSFPVLMLVVALANSARADNNYEFIDPLASPADTNGWAIPAYYPYGQFSFANGGFRLQASATPTPATAAIYPADLIYTNFQISLDVINWDRNPWPSNLAAINLAARLQGVNSLTTASGYLFYLQPNGDTSGSGTNGQVGIFRVDPGNSVTLQTNLDFLIDLTHQYRLVFTGNGPLLTGQVFDLTNLVQPVATIQMTDASYTSGNVGILANDDAPVDGLGNKPVDFTVNNFQAGPSVPLLNIQQTNNEYSDSLATAADTNGWAAGDFGFPGVSASFTITNGGYRLQASSDNPESVPILETYPTNLVYTNFQVSVDVVDWDRRPYPANLAVITVFGRAHGLGAVPSGYLFNFNPNDTNNDGMGQIGIARVDTGSFVSQTNLSCPVNITNGQYRLVFTGSGPVLTGQLFNLTNLVQPVATVQMTDTEYVSGNVGIVAFDFDGIGGSPVDFTVNNFTAGPLPLSPAVNLFWPDSYAGYSLQTTTNLNEAWQSMNITPQDSGGIYTATIETNNPIQFFRLYHP